MRATREERVALGGAVRAAVVVPVLLAFGKLVLGNQPFATFAVFGCFALLVMSDFGGTAYERARSYALATAAGGALVVLGTLVSPVPLLGAALMFAVGFAVTLAGAVAGGHVATAQTGLLLSYVLSVTLPAAPSAAPARLAGWLCAGAAATLAGTLLLGRPGPVALARAAAAACEAIADLVAAVDRDPGHPDLVRLRHSAADAVAAMRERYAQAAGRSLGSLRRERAYARLLGNLQLILETVTRPLYRPEHAARPDPAADGGLVGTVVAALRASAGTLCGGPPPDVEAVDRIRRSQRHDLDRWALAVLRAGRPADRVLDGLDVDHTLRVIAYLTMAVARYATVAGGRTPRTDPPATQVSPHRHSDAAGVPGLLAGYLTPGSTAVRNALRTGVGLAVSVWLARQLGLPHAFWVVLGTLQVLRTNALGTGRTIVGALAGNVAGVAVGAAVAILTVGHPAVLWAALPVAVFLAAWTAGSGRFVLSQAAFTVNLMVIFNLLSPVGWRVGLARLEDVGVGLAISAALSVLLWPHGARRQFARALAAYYRAATAYLADGFDAALCPDRVAGTAPAPTASRVRAELALGDYLGERASGLLDPPTAVFLLAAANHMTVAANLLRTVAAEFGYQATTCPDAVATVRAGQRAVSAGLIHLADDLDGRDGERPQPGSTEEELREAATTCLTRWRDDGTAGRSAMAVVIAGEWVRGIGALVADLDDPARRAAQAARLPWWS